MESPTDLPNARFSHSNAMRRSAGDLPSRLASSPSVRSTAAWPERAAPVAECAEREAARRLAVTVGRRPNLERVFEAALGNDVGRARRFPVEYAMALGRLADRNREQRYSGAEGDLDPVPG